MPPECHDDKIPSSNPPVSVDSPPVEHLWDVKIQYAAEHIPTHELEEMRLQIDQVGDDMLSALLERTPALLQQQGSSGLLEALKDELRAQQQQQEGRQTKKQTRSTGQQTKDARVSAFFEQVLAEPEWLDRDLLREGQLVYLRYSTSCSLGLMYFSLVGGFSAPKIVKVLDETGYLTRSGRDETWRRLNETIEMVLDCMCTDDGLEVGEVGWWSVLKVRLMHSRVRHRLLARSGARAWDAGTFGQPINQEDMMGTLCSFSINVLLSIQKTGAPWLTLKEQEAYLHLWRYIGHLIGVREENNVCTSVSRAGGAVESVVQHLLMAPTERSKQAAARVLAAVADRKVGAMKKPWSLAMHSQLARAMLGEALADALGIMAAPPSIRMHALIFLFIVQVMNLVLPLLVSRDGVVGPWLLARTRMIIRRQCDTQLYPERFGNSASTTADAAVDATAVNGDAKKKETLLAPDEQVHGSGGGTCPFGYS